MSLLPEKSNELHELVGQLCNEELHSEGFKRLAALLEGNLDAQKLYVQYLDMHQYLRELAVGLDERALLSDIQNTIANWGSLSDHIVGEKAISLSQPPANSRGDHPRLPESARKEQQSESSVEGEQTTGAPAVAPTPLPVSDESHPLVDLTQQSRLVGFFGLGAMRWAMFALLVVVGASSYLLRTKQSPPVVAPLKPIAGAEKAEKNRSDIAVAEALPKPSSATSSYVARIVKASPDCILGEFAAPGEFLLRFRAGDKLHVAVGLVEMEFHCGARIILHGPTVFAPTGPASGSLESGRLTGDVANGNFRLMTPAAEVIDLGTSFGVVADDDVGTDVVVFDGRVQVVSQPQSAEAKTVLDMTEGMSARFRFDGSTEYGLKEEAKHFARKVAANGASSEDGDLVCLIDVISGGNGTEGGLAGAVDSLTGEKAYDERGVKWQNGARTIDKFFSAVPWHSMIDGVFVPPADGLNVQINTESQAIKLPATSGIAYGSIWARRVQSALQADDARNHDFWGGRTLKGIVERLKQTSRGMIGIHANAGITFDLRTIKMVHHRRPIELRGSVANIENSADWTPEEMPEFKRTVNFHVYVDGKLRFERLGFRLEDGEAKLELGLLPDDRFLTIITTDDGNIEFDHVVLIDPVIVLAKE